MEGRLMVNFPVLTSTYVAYLRVASRILNIVGPVMEKSFVRTNNVITQGIK